MTDDKDEQPKPTGYFETLLGSQPPTDPTLLDEMTKAHFSEKHFAAIGRVATQWAYFEAVIDSWLKTFAELDWSVSVCFTAQMIGPRPRLDAFISLVRLRLADAKKLGKWPGKLEAFAQDVTGLAEQRNRAVHDLWVMDDPFRPQRMEATARRTVRLGYIHVSTDEMNALAVSISHLRIRFDYLAGEIFNVLHASPDRGAQE